LRFKGNSIAFAFVEIELFIEMGPSWSRPRIEEALGLNERFTFRFSELRKFEV